MTEAPFTEKRVFERSMNLDLPTVFSSENEYIVYTSCGTAEKVIAWGSSRLFFRPSTYNLWYGCVNHDNKRKWEYRLMGNCDVVPEGQKAAAYEVTRIVERRFVTVTLQI